MTADALIGKWFASKIAGYAGPLSSPPLGSRVFINFGRDGTWTGSDGCNDAFGSYRLGDADKLHFKLIGGTKAACRRTTPPLEALDAATRISENTGRLTFVASNGQQLGVFVRAAVSARVALSARTVVAGSFIRGSVIVQNNSGSAIHATGCISLFQVALASADVRPNVAWNKCLQQFTIPVGESRYPVRVTASYQDCDNGPARVGNIPACVNGELPPLPAGEYTATLFQGPAIVPTPPGVDVTVVPQKATVGGA